MRAVQSPIHHHQKLGRPNGSRDKLSVGVLCAHIDSKIGMSFAEAFAELLNETRIDFMTKDEKGRRMDSVTYPKLMMSTMHRIVEMPRQEINLTTQVGEMSDEELQSMARELAHQIVNDSEKEQKE